ncbi:hypothetical protein HFD88_006638 [Aspergillus terreus]|nr:hypothetical protein HFD88_006638 [Aspergillus terreus]
MPRIKQKSKAEDLARVRNNQRRCRQRKRDYVAELERRLASVEENTSQEIRRLQSIADELRHVNKQLTALLDSAGVDYSHVGSRRQMNIEDAGAMDMNMEVVPFRNPVVGPAETTASEAIPQLDFYALPSTTTEVQEASYFPSSHETELGPESLLLPEPGVSVTTLNTEVSQDEYQDTTVCAVALELVMRCNTKNLSILELDMRLRCGYRSARFQWEGCRVDNQVLFAVLSEIT